ncbi:MAG TPA: DUF481 domain-containing protein [Candidatus Eisenbacteria bacterium]|nr:DUF481 domain-containing protein [Candidatus Eisenbacteria bacterium]
MSDACRNHRSRPIRLHFLNVTLLAWLVVLPPTTVFAAKTDVIVLKNGDRITGEIKGLERGKLDYSTDDAGRPAVEWVKIARVTSPNSFEVEVSSGRKYVGRLVTAGRDGRMVVAGERVDTLAIADVVRINGLQSGFAQRTQAYLDVGLTYAKANSATTFTTAGEAAYRGDQFGSRLSYDSYAQGQESVPTTSRNSGVAQVVYFLPKRWSTVVLFSLEQNDELSLDLRFTGAGMLGRTLIQSNAMALGVAGGLAVARERFAATAGSSSEMRTSFEGVVASQWDAFRFDAPTLDFSTSLYIFPSLSDPGRVRGEFNARLKYEIISDVDVGVTLTDTFDSDPGENASTNDFITTFTIGWSYRR